MVPNEDFKFPDELGDRHDLIDALAALEEAEEKGTKSWDVLKRELGLKKP